MYINTFKYQPSDVSCVLCTEYSAKQGCTASHCPWLAERIEAGVVGYGEAVMETMPHNRWLRQRLCLLVKNFPGTLWSNIQHEKRMEAAKAIQGYCRRRDTPQYYAVMYLLTANRGAPADHRHHTGRHPDRERSGSGERSRPPAWVRRLAN